LAEIVDYDPSPQQLAPLLKAAVEVFEDFFHSLCFPMVSYPSQLGGPFVLRQLSRAAKGLENLALFKSIVSAKVMSPIAWKVITERSSSLLLMLLASEDNKAGGTVVRRLCNAAVNICSSITPTMIGTSGSSGAGQLAGNDLVAIASGTQILSDALLQDINRNNSSTLKEALLQIRNKDSKGLKLVEGQSKRSR
jgi:hypothetical protein